MYLPKVRLAWHLVGGDDLVVQIEAKARRVGDSGEAVTHLRQALTIYQRIGAHPAAQRVQETLEQHRLTASTAQPGTAPPSQEDNPRQPPAASSANR